MSYTGDMRRLARFRRRIPKANLCKCGHVGDAEDTQHSNTIQGGHGPCRVKGCDCIKYTWVPDPDEAQ